MGETLLMSANIEGSSKYEDTDLWEGIRRESQQAMGMASMTVTMMAQTTSLDKFQKQSRNNKAQSSEILMTHNEEKKTVYSKR